MKQVIDVLRRKRPVQVYCAAMKKFVLLFFSFLISVSSGYGADHFVRPSGGDYGTGDGGSYENAWNGFGNIKWDEIMPGDNLYICDTHVGSGLTIGRSGEDGLPVTIRGDCQGDPGIIIGASAVFTDGWELHDANHNIWKRSFSATSDYSDWQAFEKSKGAPSVEAIVRLNNVGNKETAGTGELADFLRWKPGSYYREGDTLYYRPTSGSANDHIYYAGYSKPCIFSSNRNNFNIMRLKVMMGAGSKYKGVITLRNLHHVTLDEVSVKWGVYGIVFSPEWSDRKKVSSDYVIIRNCTVSECRAGIYPFGRVNHCLITGNHIYDIDQHGYYLYLKKDRWNGDIHGIALQGGGDDLRIEGNHVHHVGSEGIFPYGDNNPEGVNVQNLQNFSIKYNLVHDIQYLGSAVKPYSSSGKQSALYYNQNNNFPSEGLSNNVMAYNILYNAAHGVRMKCNANKNTGKAPWEVYNNVIYNADIGLSWYSTGSFNPYNKPGVTFKNNIIMNARSAFVSIATPTIKEYDQVFFDNNIYYPDLTEGFQWPGGKGNFDAWKSWNSGAYLDGHSKIANPRFVDHLRHDFHLLEDSPAIDGGQFVGLREDHEGKLVPQGKAPEIGAFEFPVQK